MALHHHQVYSREHAPAYATQCVSKHKGYPVSPEQEWVQARVSMEGGRGHCFVCGYDFGMSYMALVYHPRSLRGTVHVCKACQEVCKFTKVV
jgi:hypothetical protein